MSKKPAAELKVALTDARDLVRRLDADLKDALAAEADPAMAGQFAPGWSDRTREALRKAQEEVNDLFGQYMRQPSLP